MAPSAISVWIKANPTKYAASGAGSAPIINYRQGVAVKQPGEQEKPEDQQGWQHALYDQDCAEANDRQRDHELGCRYGRSLHVGGGADDLGHHVADDQDGAERGRGREAADRDHGGQVVDPYDRVPDPPEGAFDQRLRYISNAQEKSQHREESAMAVARRTVLQGMLTTGASLATLTMPAAAAPEGTMTWGVHHRPGVPPARAATPRRAWMPM